MLLNEIINRIKRKNYDVKNFEYSFIHEQPLLLLKYYYVARNRFKSNQRKTTDILSKEFIFIVIIYHILPVLYSLSYTRRISVMFISGVAAREKERRKVYLDLISVTPSVNCRFDNRQLPPPSSEGGWIAEKPPLCHAEPKAKHLNGPDTEDSLVPSMGIGCDAPSE